MKINNLKLFGQTFCQAEDFSRRKVLRGKIFSSARRTVLSITRLRVAQNLFFANLLLPNFDLWYNAPALERLGKILLIDLFTGQLDLARFVAVVVALVVGISVHEFSHALAATWLGDTLPERQGRLTLSPVAHLDPIGSLMILFAGFGYGRPVQYNPYALRASPRVGSLIVAVAGPVSNLVLATLLAVIVRGLSLGSSVGQVASDVGFVSAFLSLLLVMIQLNLVLAFFNLIPVFPLDGFSVLLGLLPPELAFRFEQTRQWGMYILFALVIFGGGFFSLLINPPVNFLFRLLVGR